ncbi:hypothetical protein MTO96_041231 [Rhipicephalus appendiculatus]
MITMYKYLLDKQACAVSLPSCPISCGIPKDLSAEHKESDYIIVLLCQRKCARPYVPEGLCLRKGVSSRLTNAGAFQCWERSPR